MLDNEQRLLLDVYSIPSMLTRLCRVCLKLAHLSVSSLAHLFRVKQPSAMAASGSVVGDAAPSMVGAAPARGEALDQYQWGRGALNMAKMDAHVFAKLATVLGTHGAGEVLLLAVARACGGDASLWDKARSVGIPWQRKNWPALSKVQEQYVGAVETALPPGLDSERLVGGDAASSVARLIPSMPTHAPPWTHGKA